MNNWIEYNNLKSIIILTKIDLISKNDIMKKVKYFEKEFEKKVFLFSNKFKKYNDIILLELDKYVVE